MLTDVMRPVLPFSADVSGSALDGTGISTLEQEGAPVTDGELEETAGEMMRSQGGTAPAAPIAFSAFAADSGASAVRSAAKFSRSSYQFATQGAGKGGQTQPSAADALQTSRRDAAIKRIMETGGDPSKLSGDTYYKLLGVNINVTPAELGKAYRQTIFSIWGGLPNVSGDAERAASIVITAYHALADARKKAVYDQTFGNTAPTESDRVISALWLPSPDPAERIKAASLRWMEGLGKGDAAAKLSSYRDKELVSLCLWAIWGTLMRGSGQGRFDDNRDALVEKLNGGDDLDLKLAALSAKLRVPENVDAAVLLAQDSVDDLIKQLAGEMAVEHGGVDQLLELLQTPRTTYSVRMTALQKLVSICSKDELKAILQREDHQLFVDPETDRLIMGTILYTKPMEGVGMLPDVGKLTTPELQAAYKLGVAMLEKGMAPAALSPAAPMPPTPAQAMQTLYADRRPGAKVVELSSTSSETYASMGRRSESELWKIVNENSDGPEYMGALMTLIERAEGQSQLDRIANHLRENPLTDAIGRILEKRREKLASKE